MKTTIILACLSALFVRAEDVISFRLGRQLLSEGNGESAALEFRRYAMDKTESEKQSEAYLHAAYSYLTEKLPADARQMLQQSEKLNTQNPALPALQAETAVLADDPQTALYFMDLYRPEADNLKIYRTRRSAEMLIRSGDPESARQKLQESVADETGGLAAIDHYLTAGKKSPAVGGWLGLIPGAGYWYSGETANGFRSLILNSLFIFGMVHTAQEEQWGAFAAISFFEITWYSGSIYGGIDAAHRFNRTLTESCIERLNVPDIESNPDVTIPLFQLRVAF